MWMIPNRSLTHTQFCIGSATKPFTATVTLKMVERGEIELDAPIRRYLPNFQVCRHRGVRAGARDRPGPAPHRTGWQGDFFDDCEFGRRCAREGRAGPFSADIC
jgi:CubicO group peptidase (beta-lactamase class C family)